LASSTTKWSKAKPVSFAKMLSQEKITPSEMKWAERVFGIGI
jgi:hypothetical protein